MGKAQLEAWMYMGMRSGEPQPMTTMEVGGERVVRVVGGMEAERVRTYS